MKDAYTRSWPCAVEELSAKYASREPVSIWYRDQHLDFVVTSINRNPTGDRIELAREGVTAAIFTRDESDDVDLRFYSKG